MNLPHQPLKKYPIVGLLFFSKLMRESHAFQSFPAGSPNSPIIRERYFGISASAINENVDSSEMDALPRESSEMRKNRLLWEEQDEKYPQYETSDVDDSDSTRNKIPTKVPKLSDVLSSVKTVSEKQSTLSTSSNSKNNNIRKGNDSKSSKKLKNKKAWKAGFVQSRKTQNKIKAAASLNYHESPSFKENENLDKAIRVLSVILETPSYECNEVNVVYALTLSAKFVPKVSSNNRNREQVQEFHSKILQIIEVLSQLIKEERLSGRQLTNAAWATMRHYVTNYDLFCEKDNADYEKSVPYFVEAIMESIAFQLMDIISKPRNEDLSSTSSASKIAEKEIVSLKPAELSMAAWAYAMLKPRDCPAGWNFPSQETMLPHTLLNQKSNLEQKRNFQKQDTDITFEEASDYTSFSPGKKRMQPYEPSTTDLLFNSIADSFIYSSQQLPLMKQCSWRELSNLAWSFASHGAVRNPSDEVERFLTALAEETIERLQSLDDQESNKLEIQSPLPRDISMLAWSFGIIQVDDYHLSKPFGELLDAISFHFLSVRNEISNNRPFIEWNSADIVQIAISLAHGRFDKKELIHALFLEAVQKLKFNEESFQSGELSALLWVQAKLNLTESQGEIQKIFAETVVKVLSKRLKIACKNKGVSDELDVNGSNMDISIIGIGPQEQANLAWSLTALEVYNPDSTLLLQSIFASASAENVGSFNEENSYIKLEHAHQLWQALFVLREDCPDAVKYVSSSFGKFLKEKWDDEKSREKTSSHRHKALSQTLNFMRVKHYNEHDEDIDIALVLGGPNVKWTHKSEKNANENKNEFNLENPNPKVAVEFDGPTHFTRIDDGSKPRALGHTVMKYRMLKIKGWTVVRVPYYEFDKIPFWASMERQRYLQRALKTHANIKFSEIDVSEYKPQVPNRKSRFD